MLSRWVGLVGLSRWAIIGKSSSGEGVAGRWLGHPGGRLGVRRHGLAGVRRSPWVRGVWSRMGGGREGVSWVGLVGGHGREVGRVSMRPDIPRGARGRGGPHILQQFLHLLRLHLPNPVESTLLLNLLRELIRTHISGPSHELVR